ncbi:MAG: OmpH family outer membrane protein [Bacteroidales bacterium]|nr:OmpH family outer membrane protein [Bacteroidales bacterium]
MKQIKLILCVALAIAFTSCKQNQNNVANGDGSAAPVAGSIVYVQLDSVINNFDMFNDLKSELEVKVEKIQNELQAKGRDFQNAAKDFENKINKGLLTQAEAQERNRVLTNRQQDLQNLTAQKEAEIQEEQAVMLNKVMDAVETYVKKYNQEKKFALILTTTSATTTVLCGEPSLDITNDIIEGLNNEYVKNKKKSSTDSETETKSEKKEAAK